jgi:hypothetical protein
MATRTAEPSPRVRARVTGLLYLSTIPLGFFSLQYVPSHLLVPGDAATTARNIQASESLFRLGIVSDLIGQIVLLLAALALYQLLKPANKNMAWLMVIFNLLGVPIAMLSELNNVAVLFLVSGADTLKGFTADQVHTLVSLFLNLHANGLGIAALFWGLWLFPMGYAVFKSGFLPRILGILLMIACVGYLIQSVADLLFPTLNVNIILFTSWGELLFPLWLVVKGVNGEQWEKRALASA